MQAQFNAGFYAKRDHVNQFTDSYPGCKDCPTNASSHDNDIFCEKCYDACKNRLVVDQDEWRYLNLRLFAQLSDREKREEALQFFGMNSVFEVRFTSLLKDTAEFADAQAL